MSSYYYTHSSRNVGGFFVPTRRGDPEALPHASPPSLINSGGMAGGQAIFPLADSRRLWLLASRRATYVPPELA